MKDDTNSFRIAIISLIVEHQDSAIRINEILHQYGSHIIGRMGIPCPNRGLNLISIAVDAKQEIISALSGKLGSINGVTAKTLYSKSGGNNESNL